MDNPVVIVTGGGSGIGRAAALRFAHEGAKVVIVGRRIAPLEKTAAGSDRMLAVVADVRQDSEIRQVVQAAVDRWGRIDVLVNNAGAFTQRSLAEIDRPTIASLFETNVVGPSLLTQAALPALKESHGAVVNISSTFGRKAAPMISHYAASKAALEHLTRCWALELAPFQIRVNAVAPGPTETEILARSGLSASRIEAIQRNEAASIPLGRRGTAEEVAAWIVHLAEPSADWMTGQVLAVDGGLTIA